MYCIFFQGLFPESFSLPTMGGSAPELHQIQRLSKLGAGPEDDRERLGPRHLLPQREAGDLPHSHCKQQTTPHLPERDRLLQYKVSGYVIRCRQVLIQMY